MIPTVKLMLVLATVLGVVLISINSTPHKGKKSGNQGCVNFNCVEAKLRNAAQEKLKAIGVNHSVSASYVRAGKGQHVFNNGLLKLHYKVLKDLLTQVGGYEQLKNLKQDLKIPLNQTVQDAIGTWVASFSSGEFYVDFNADVFGQYVRQLRNALVEYLKADTSDNEDERNRVQEKRQLVQPIASAMVKHEVYVDPMAHDRWLQKNRKKLEQMYDQVKRELSDMFQNILQDFKNVSDKIRDFRRRYNWNWGSDLK